MGCRCSCRLGRVLVGVPGVDVGPEPKIGWEWGPRLEVRVVAAAGWGWGCRVMVVRSGLSAVGHGGYVGGVSGAYVG